MCVFKSGTQTEGSKKKGQVRVYDCNEMGNKMDNPASSTNKS